MDHIINEELGNVITKAYTAYALDIIGNRMFPDLRDGLKPVQRKIIWAMYLLGIKPNTLHKKCARIVGEVIGKYSPHGDSATYEALVRMAQNWIMNETLVDGHGNFGNFASDDSAAAMRYTEARLEKIAMEFLKDVDSEIVDFIPNFDNSEVEPSILTPTFPNILVNGASGVAVGIATSIPPHNLREVCDATIALLKDKNSNPLDYIKGPDFPTGGYMEKETIQSVLSGGGGSVRIFSDFLIEHNILKVVSVPYGITKTELLEKINYQLSKIQNVEITNFIDQSKKEHVEFIFKCNNPELFKTHIQNFCSNTFSYNMIVLNEDKKPILMDFKTILEQFLKFRKIVVYKRLTKQIKKLNEKIHLLRTFLIFKNVQELVDVLTKNDAEKVDEILKTKYKLDKIQIDFLLSKNLKTLIKSEFKKIEIEYNELMLQLSETETKRTKDIDKIIIEELEEAKKLYGSPRKTKIIQKEEIKEISTTFEEQFLIGSENGELKRVPSLDGVRRYNGFVHAFGKDFVVITKSGEAIRIDPKSVPMIPYNKNGIKYPGISSVVRIIPLDKNINYLFVVGEEGCGAVIDVSNFKNLRLNKPYRALNTNKLINAFFVPNDTVYEAAKAIVWGEKKFIMFNLKEIPIINPGGKGVIIFRKELIKGIDVFMNCVIEDINGNLYKITENIMTGRARSGNTCSVSKIYRVQDKTEIWENGKFINVDSQKLLKKAKDLK
jgi:DNA gyrase/topoisomerase IV subunit A